MSRATLVAPCAFAFAFACTTPSTTDALVEFATALPPWLGAPTAIARDARLEEAAALLCARDTDGVIDEDVRRATGLADGIVLGLLERNGDLAEAKRALAQKSAPLLARMRANVAGAVEGITSAGQPCVALVAVRRLVAIGAPPKSQLAAGEALTLDVRVDNAFAATLYALRPDGFVDKMPVRSGGASVSVPAKKEGRYIVELLVDDGKDGRVHDPQVALLWPYLVGAPKAPPFPEVLFPDEGHDDIALTHRAEALVQRLRNEQLIEPFKVSPPLIEVAAERARAVAQAGTLGHRVDGRDVVQALHERFGAEPRGQFVRVAEVQAQASTLADAWQALLDSPAHRYELVDTAYTHCGVAVARGQDAAGRATITVVALLARRPPQTDVGTVRAQIADVINGARDGRGLHEVTQSAHLDRVAMRLAEAMRDQQRVDEALLGDAVGKIALEADASLTRVRPLVARVDDPMMLVEKGAPELFLDIDVTRVGMGMALSPEAGVFYVCLLAGE